MGVGNKKARKPITCIVRKILLDINGFVIDTCFRTLVLFSITRNENKIIKIEKFGETTIAAERFHKKVMQKLFMQRKSQQGIMDEIEYLTLVFNTFLPYPVML